MRASTFLAFCWIMLLLVAPVLADDKPIEPKQAKDHVGKEVLVEMTVKASKKSLKMKKVFLDSLEDFNDADDLGITLNETIEAELAQKHSTEDVAEFFKQKVIRVSGTVVRRDDRTYIDVEKSDQIKLVDKK